jgi:uncharacterized protein with PIN domain
MKEAVSRVRSAEPKHKFNSYSPSFLVDAMLGDIARKLRIFGYDTLYVKDTSDKSILEIASREKRILLTRDKELFKRVVKTGIEGVLLEQYDEIDNIAYTLSKYGISCLSFNTGIARCPCCNGILMFKDATEFNGALPKKIIKNHRVFFQCLNCDKIYWEGKHVSRLHLLVKKINNKIRKFEKESANEPYAMFLNKRLKSLHNSKTVLSQNAQNSNVR